MKKWKERQLFITLYIHNTLETKCHSVRLRSHLQKILILSRTNVPIALTRFLATLTKIPRLTHSKSFFVLLRGDVFFPPHWYGIWTNTCQMCHEHTVNTAGTFTLYYHGLGWEELTSFSSSQTRDVASFLTHNNRKRHKHYMFSKCEQLCPLSRLSIVGCFGRHLGNSKNVLQMPVSNTRNRASGFTSTLIND